MPRAAYPVVVDCLDGDLEVSTDVLVAVVGSDVKGMRHRVQEYSRHDAGLRMLVGGCKDVGDWLLV